MFALLRFPTFYSLFPSHTQSPSPPLFSADATGEECACDWIRGEEFPKTFDVKSEKGNWRPALANSCLALVNSWIFLEVSVVGVRGGEKKDEGGGHVREGSKRGEFLKFYQLQRFGLISTHTM